VSVPLAAGKEETSAFLSRAGLTEVGGIRRATRLFDDDDDDDDDVDRSREIMGEVS